MISNIVRNYIRKVKPYLKFKSSTPMTITPNYTNTGITLQYSLDKVTWTNISAKGVTPSASVIYFRGCATGTKSLYVNDIPHNAHGQDSIYVNNAWLFTGATNLKVYGDITMLIQDILGGMVRDIPLGTYAFTNMFYGCVSLVKAPDLPSLTLTIGCYQEMFFKCTSLTTAPALPATVLATYCYIRMFRECTSLTTAPALPATTLADYCYQAMFRLCTSLTTVPKLPATTLANYCYANMFYGCIKIKLTTTKTGDYVNEYRLPTVGTGVTATGALNDTFTDTGGTFVGTPTINTTYYTENEVI